VRGLVVVCVFEGVDVGVFALLCGCGLECFSWCVIVGVWVLVCVC